MGGRLAQTLSPPPHPRPQEVQNIEQVRATFGPNLAPKAPEHFHFLIPLGRGRVNFVFRTCASSHTYLSPRVYRNGCFSLRFVSHSVESRMDGVPFVQAVSSGLRQACDLRCLRNSPGPPRMPLSTGLECRPVRCGNGATAMKLGSTDSVKRLAPPFATENTTVAPKHSRGRYVSTPFVPSRLCP